MRTFNATVFDDFVMGTNSVYTGEEFNDQLGLSDQLAIQAVSDQVTGTSPTLTVQIEHSADQRNWTSKTTNAEINAEGLSTTNTSVYVATDTGATPSLPFVRLRIRLTGTLPVAHVKLHVCGRDQA